MTTRPYLRRTGNFPRTKEIPGTMVTGQPYPPVPVRKAWHVYTPQAGHVGAVLDTRWGYRAITVAGAWSGCWYTSRDMCRDAIVRSQA